MPNIGSILDKLQIRINKLRFVKSFEVIFKPLVRNEPNRVLKHCPRFSADMKNEYTVPSRLFGHIMHARLRIGIIDNSAIIERNANPDKHR